MFHSQMPSPSEAMTQASESSMCKAVTCARTALPPYGRRRAGGGPPGRHVAAPSLCECPCPKPPRTGPGDHGYTPGHVDVLAFQFGALLQQSYTTRGIRLIHEAAIRPVGSISF